MTSLQSWQNASSADIRGNAPQELKDIIFGIFEKYFWTPHVGKFFGSTIFRGVRIERVSVDADLDSPSESRAQTSVACKYVITPDMCDHRQKLHGGCLAFMTDMFTSNVFLLMKRPTVSLNINVVQHVPIPVGTTVLAIATSVNANDNVHDARLKIYDASNGALLASGEHLEMRPSAGPGKVMEAVDIPPDNERIVYSRTEGSDRRNANEISGTANADTKKRIIDSFEHRSRDVCFAEYVKRRIRVLGVDEVLHEGKNRTRMECETQVKQDMVNGMKTLHGGCGSYLVEECSLVLLHALGGDWQGLNLNTNFHAPAPRDSVVKIITTTVSTGKRVSTVRTEIIDAKSGRLLVSGTSTLLRIQSPPARL